MNGLEYSCNYKIYPCPICSSFKHKIIFRDIDDYSYSICEDCSYVFQALRKNRIVYEKLPYHTQPNYEEHSKNRSDYILKFCKNFIDRNSRINILDIGCARGGVMKAIRDSLPECSIMGYTLDMNETPVDKDLKIVYQNIEDLPLNSKTHFDFIVMAHVVEHLYDPVIAMKNVRSLMYHNSFLYIEVPSFDVGEVRSPSIFTSEHISFFTKNSLENLLKSSGLEIVKIKENKYWGNIKVIAKKSYKRQPEEIKKMNYKYSLFKKSALKLLYPFFRLNSKDKNND